MGFEPENIYVLKPGGFNPLNWDSDNYPEGFDELKEAYRDRSYSHEATNENLARITRHIAQKADSNDTFVFYLSTHGNRTYDSSTDTVNCLIGMDDGKQQLYDYELGNMVRPIEAGRELYFIDACHSGKFAGVLGQGNDMGVAAGISQQVALMDFKGNSLGSYFLDELGKVGFDYETSADEVQGCLENAYERYHDNFKNLQSKEQVPLFVHQGRVTPVNLIVGQKKPAA